MVVISTSFDHNEDHKKIGTWTAEMTNVDIFNQVPFLEQDALRAISQEDLTTFERYVSSLHYVLIYCRRVVQLKAVYQNNANLVPTESTHKALGLYLLYLLASDRIGMVEFFYTISILP